MQLWNATLARSNEQRHVMLMGISVGKEGRHKEVTVYEVEFYAKPLYLSIY